MMKIVNLIFGVAILASLTLTNSACKKKNLFGDGNLSFSTDTLVFDTVFTTIGSTTKYFKIYNPQSKALKISQVELMGGSASKFKLNLDGLQGTSFSDLEIPSGDSLFCFVEVKLSVNGQNLPVIVEDSVRFTTNGEDQYVKLAAWGQDMYYHYSNIGAGIFDLNEGTWPNDKPHVIYNSAFVDSAKTLNIIGGTHIYLHKGAILWNYKGTLNIDGDYNNKVTIQGDRLEAAYKDVPGQYYGIYLQEARPSLIDNVVIKNAIAGIHVDSRDPAFSQNTLTISNTEILNAASYGLFLFDGPKVYGENVLVHSTGVHSLLVIQGADFTFNQCDFLGYGTGEGTTPAVGISNYYTNSQGTTVAQIPNANFNNCVIYGSNGEHLAIDTIQTGGLTLNFHFRNSVILKSNLGNPMFTSCSNSNPAFVNPNGDDFKFYSTSSLSNNANPTYSTAQDIRGFGRNSPPDIGVYDLP
ncbi:right-handed parallel beta-helix repeat-containing protein [Fluviicola taffensis]|uniref:right-handed parallel beta-helix repeat-containing protein n=1 Tax=Fluviicola taffensis TaxID=191579 RepID=UPI00313841A8